MALKQHFYINQAGTEAVLKRVLCMRIGERHFSFSISDKIGDRLCTLAYYTDGEINPDTLSEVFSRHGELHASFAAVQVCYDHPASILAPTGHFHGAHARKLIQAVHGSTAQSVVLSEPVKPSELYNAYAVPEDIHEWVGRIFPAFRFRHHYTLAVNNLSDPPKHAILLELDTDEFSFLVWRDGKLMLAQTLRYVTPEDILYVLIKSCNQFSLSREDVDLYISGLIVKESQLYRELYQYFLRTRFRDVVWKIDEPENNPPHFFASLNDLARCVS